MADEVEELKNRLRRKVVKSTNPIRVKDLLSTGSTLLNLACTGRPGGGFLKGKYFFIVGDSISGKTFLSLTCLAEAAQNRYFRDYRFIYDNAEDGALMDVERFFGSKVASRLESPSESQVGPIYSSTIEEFYYHVDDAFGEDRPFVYILDSMDSLSSEVEIEKFVEKKDAHRKGKEVAGSYGVSKARMNSEGIRKLIPQLRDTGSILIIINQTRDNLGFGFERRTRSGGHALRFYATVEMWSSVKSRIKKTVKGKPRQIGILAKIEIKKNRITGRERTIEIPIYHSTGIDDVGSCIEYLLGEKHWKKSGQSIIASEFEFQGTQEKLIEKIEESGLERDLQGVVADVWNEIEELSAVHRRRKYE